MIAVGVQTKYSFATASSPVSEIVIISNVNAGLINAQIEVLKDRSSLIKENAPGSTYKYLNIWVGTSGFSTPKNIKEATIKFKIENSWLTSGGFKDTDVVLMRWNGTEWIQLVTQTTNKNASFTYYEGKTNAFSPFAIVVIKVPEDILIKTTPEDPIISTVTVPKPKTPNETFTNEKNISEPSQSNEKSIVGKIISSKFWISAFLGIIGAIILVSVAIILWDKQERNTVNDLQLKPIDRVKVDKREPSNVKFSKPDIKSSVGNTLYESAELKIEPNYKTLVNKDVQIIILVKNMSRYTINDVDVTLKFDDSRFSIKDTQFKKLQNITKGGKKTVEYILTPIVACIPSSEINAIINYNDAENNTHTVYMKPPMTLQCIAPNLAPKPMNEKEFVKLFESHKCQVKGIVFKGISEETVTDFIKSIKDRSTVKNILVNGIRVMYLSSEAKDKSFYLLTVIIRDEDNLTYVALKACSNNEAGINNSIDQVLDHLRFHLKNVRSAREVENITNNKSVQIINSEIHGGVSIGGNAQGRNEGIDYGSKR